MKKVNNTINTILNKKFNVELSGYNPLEVDEFLDLITKDYEQFNFQIDELIKKNELNINRINFLEEENEKLKNLVSILEEKNSNSK